MRIGYFGRPIGSIGGIGRYSYELLAALGKIAPGYEYFVYTNRPARLPAFEGLTARFGPQSWGRVLWEQVWLRAQLHRDQIDVYHSADFTLPLVPGMRCVVNVHDLIFLQSGLGTSLSARLLYRTFAAASARRATHVVALSHYVGGQIEKLLGIEKSKIRVIPPGVDPGFETRVTMEEASRLMGDAGIPRPFALFVGVLTARKGLIHLIDVFERARRQSGLEALVLAGPPGLESKAILSRIGRCKEPERIFILGHIDDRLLAALYGAAKVFCFPSAHEGFGLPVLEAMLFGCPVISSNAAALPEAVGSAGLLAPPEDVDQWVEHLVRVSTDGPLAAELSRRGRERARLYTWERTARQIFSVYKETAASVSSIYG